MIIEVDARGLACPKPVINTKKELEKLEEGVVITTVDNNIAKENILKLAKSLNCESMVIKEEENLISINGLYMLVAQAVKAQEIWNGVSIDEEIIKEIYEKLKLHFI